MRFLSFEEPMGPLLTRLLYYFGLIGIVVHVIDRVIFWVPHLAGHFWDALWALVKLPFIAVLMVFVLRVATEFVLAQFRIDQSLHDQVTGRVAKPTTEER